MTAVPSTRVFEADPRLADYRLLTDHAALRARGLFVAEGRLVVRRAIESGLRVRSLLLSDAAHRGLDSSLAGLPSNVPVYVCDLALFETVTGHHIHRGCLAMVERPPAAAPSDLVAAATTLVVLDGVSNADNIGSVFRTAAAFGVDAIVLGPGCADPLYRKAVRTSMAATLRVRFAHIADWPAGREVLCSHGLTIVALTPREPALTLEAFASAPRPDRVALLIGAEGTGLSAEALALADVRVRISIRPDVDSLNLGVAAGIALSRLAENRRG